MSPLSLPRRDFIKSGGSLVVGFSIFGRGGASFAQERSASSLRAVVAGPPDQKLIDTWIAVHADNTATA